MSRLEHIGSMYGIFTNIYQKNELNVGKHTSPMDPMGKDVNLDGTKNLGFPAKGYRYLASLEG